jgi:hypothetical protein
MLRPSQRRLNGPAPPDALAERRAASAIERLLASSALGLVERSSPPYLEDLQRRVEQRGENLDLIAAAATLDPAVGAIDDQGRVRLTIECLACEPVTHELIEDYVRVVRMAADRFWDPHRHGVSGRDIRRRLGLPPERVKQLWHVMDTDSEVFGRRGRPRIGDLLARRRPVAPGAQRYAAVVDVTDLLRLRRERARLAVDAQAAVGARGNGSHATRWSSRLRRSVVVAVAGGTATALLTGVLGADETGSATTAPPPVTTGTVSVAPGP